MSDAQGRSAARHRIAMGAAQTVDGPAFEETSSGDPAMRRPRRITILAIGASLGLALGCGVPRTAHALTIIGEYDGSAFSATPYFTCGPDWDCADPSTHSPAVNPTAQWVINAFDAAARYWEQRIDDPWTVTIRYGFGPSPGGTGHFSGSTFSGDRWTSGSITFNSAVTDWFLSPNPGQNQEYQPLTVARQALPGAQSAIPVTTGLTTAAIPYGPASVPQVLCGTTPCGAHQDLMTGAIHEIAHALNLDTFALLTRFNDTWIRSSDVPLLGLMRVPDGPLAGALIPWTSGGGGHTFLKPSPGAMPLIDPSNPPPPEFSDPRLDTPNGDLITNGYFFYGSHRRLVSDLDAVIIATVSDFKRVNLTDRTYVALRDFAGTTTLQAEKGGQSSLLTVNGAAALVDTTNAAGDGITALRLTPDEASQAGSAFLTKPFSIWQHTSFESRFGFRAGGANGCGANGSDGFAFVLQADPRGASAIGNGGEGLGYGNNPTFGNSVPAIHPSLAVEFDTHQNGFDPSGNHVGFVLDGDVGTHAAWVDVVTCLNDGEEHFAWVDYDATQQLLSFYLSDTDVKPDNALLSEIIDLSGLWGTQAYFGFTGATGRGFNYHDILSWDLQVSVPEPGSFALTLAGLFGLIAYGVGSRTHRRGARGP